MWATGIRHIRNEPRVTLKLKTTFTYCLQYMKVVVFIDLFKHFY